MVAWLGADLVKSGVLKPNAAGAIGAGALCAYAVAASLQVPVWRNSETLYKKALRATSGNYPAHYNLAVHLRNQGRSSEATSHFRSVVEIIPGHPTAHNSLGVLHAQAGDTAQAILHFQQCLETEPRNAEALANLGMALAQIGRPQKGIEYAKKAVQAAPESPHAQAALVYVQGVLDRANPPP